MVPVFPAIVNQKQEVVNFGNLAKVTKICFELLYPRENNPSEVLRQIFAHRLAGRKFYLPQQTLIRLHIFSVLSIPSQSFNELGLF